VTLLVFRLGALVLGSGPTAFAAAFLFALHPIHTEAVARAVGRAELLAAAAVAGGLIVSFESSNRRAWRAIAAAAIFGAGLLASEATIAFLPIWVMVALYRAEGPLGARLRSRLADYRLWGLAAAAVLYLLFRYAMLGRVAPIAPAEATFVENPLAYAGAATRLRTAVVVLGRYALLVLFPFRLTSDYSYAQMPPVGTPLDPEFLAAASGLAALAAAALALRRRQPIYLLALGFFFAALAPVANILVPMVPIGSIMAERFLYLPSIAAVWVLARLVEHAGWIGGLGDERRLARGRPSRGTVMVVLALVLPWGVKTLARNREWRDDSTLLQATRRISPRSARVHLLSGQMHVRAGDYALAIESYRAALRIDPDYAAAAIELAAAYDAIGSHREAIELLESFKGRSGALEQARVRALARAFLGLGDYAGAASLYEAVVAADDRDALAHRDLGGLYLQHLGQPERGRAHLRRSLELAPDQPGADRIRAALGGR
jgi:tetratricopeptide (TPR) repeat protein